MVSNKTLYFCEDSDDTSTIISDDGYWYLFPQQELQREDIKLFEWVFNISFVDAATVVSSYNNFIGFWNKA